MADGVWLLRGGVPRTMNVYFLEDEGGGVTLFDAGIRQMTNAVATAAAPLGGINRVVLGHADVDHRGVAAGLGVPVFCHPAERAAAEEGEPQRDYHRTDLLRIPSRWVYPRLLEYWNSGPVEIAGTVDGGRRRQRLPRRAPARPRARADRAVPRERPARADERRASTWSTSTRRAAGPGAAADAFNQDTAQARESIRKLAALDPAVCWPGHLGPLEGDVRAQLERAAGGVMARRNKLKAPTTEYRSPDGDVLVLRGSMTPGTRQEYAAALGGSPLSQEDAWHRAVEFLFERLAVSWAVAGIDPIKRQKELLARFRMASQDERAWIRDVLREHLAENFPELSPP